MWQRTFIRILRFHFIIVVVQEDGYYSEGGSSFYARKIQSRIALEKQKTAEEQRKKLASLFYLGANPIKNFLS
jgi:hypothetical protein